MMSHPSIIAPTASSEERDGTNSSLNPCSHVTCPNAKHRLPITRCSLAEMHRQYVVDIAVHVAHIRELVMLEAGV